MKKLLAIAALLFSSLLHAQGFPYTPATQIVCGTSNGTPAACGTLPNGLNLGVPSFIDLTNATNFAISAITPIGSNTVLGNFTAGSAAPQAYNAVLISNGTSGGIMAWTSSTTLTSSGVLPASNIVIGGGAGQLPSTLAGTGMVAITAGAAQIYPLNPNGTASNVSLGPGGPLANATGISNTAAGQNAFATQTTPNSNTGFGLSAGRYVSTGGNSTAIGSLALTGVSGTPTTGSNNTAIGFQALTSVQGTGGGNTGIGPNTCSLITTGSNNTCIGNAVGSAGMLTNTNVVMIGSTNACVPTSTTSTNELIFCAGSTYVLKSTGTGAPATSRTFVPGTLNAGDTTGVAIASLPTCNAARQGDFTYVSNGQATPTYLGAVSTTGSTIAPVFCNGTGWVYH